MWAGQAGILPGLWGAGWTGRLTPSLDYSAGRLRRVHRLGEVRFLEFTLLPTPAHPGLVPSKGKCMFIHGPSPLLTSRDW